MFTILIAALALQSTPVADQAPVSEQTQVSAVLDALNVASTAHDTTAYFDLFTPDARFIGTDRSERWSLAEFRAYTEPYFAQGKGWTYASSDRVITIADIPCRCIAWFDEQLDNASYGQTRGSGVLRLTREGWKIEQYVLSFAVPNARAAAVVAAIKADPAP